jgi:hypothetical protein
MVTEVATQIPGIPIQALVFLAVIGIALTAPVILDQIIQYKFQKKKIEKLGNSTKGEKNINDVSKPSPSSGLYRSLMTFGVILLIGAMLLYVLGILGNYVQPLSVTMDSAERYIASLPENNPTTINQSAIITNLLVSHGSSINVMSGTMLNIIRDVATILGGAVSAIVGFYFGNKAATDAVPEKPTPPSSTGETTGTTGETTGTTGTTGETTGTTGETTGTTGETTGTTSTGETTGTTSTGETTGTTSTGETTTK